jgi:signal transduction histidine kinase/ligand-binding sensor domain-containing protein
VPDVEPGIGFVTEDREGDIWLATDGGGIRRLRPKSSMAVDVQVTSVTSDPDGDVWFAAAGSGVLRRHQGKQDIFPMTWARIPLHVMTVCADRERRIWITTIGGIFRFPTSDPKQLTRIDGSVRDARMLFAARNGDVWTYARPGFGFYRDEVFHPIGSALPADDRVTAIAEAPAGPVWFGTSRGNLYVSSGDTIVPVNRPGGRWSTIHALLPEPGGALWVGTADGLIYLERGESHRLTMAEGLPDRVVLHLLQDSTDLWMATAGGLFRVPRADLAAFVRGERARINPIAYGPEEGLAAISPITNEMPAVTTDEQGNLWFCTYKGAIGVVTSRVQHDAPPPPVLIEEVRFDERRVNGRDRLQVPAGTHRLEFHFAALSFAVPQRVQLRHQLDGFDSEWTDTAPDRIARYAKLAPGDYHLRVIASNGEGVWNELGAELSFTVLPAWYQTVWFSTAVVTVFAALIFGAARYWSHRKYQARLERLEREHALEQERARIARDMHDELGGSVTGINLAVQRLRDLPDGDVHGIADILARRVRALTVELERVVWTVSPKHSTLEQLASFIERFAHNLLADSPIACRVYGRESIPASPVSPDVQHHVLAITKEAINNVVKHSRARELVIEMSADKETFTLVVRDDGVGFDPDEHEFSDRNGLRNMRARIEEVNGTLALRSVAGAGTEVTLRVNIAARQ